MGSRETSINFIGDSDKGLNDHFNLSLQRDTAEFPLPLTCRNLPKSFFSPPDTTVNKSNEIFHARSHSSPATFINPGNSGSPTPLNGTIHVRHQSYAPTSIPEEQTDPGDGLGPLPPHWSIARTPNNEIYFINHVDQKTSWVDPRGQRASFKSNSQFSPKDYQNLVSQLPLPENWEIAKTPDGEMYFINHAMQTTTWNDPRLDQLKMLLEKHYGPYPGYVSSSDVETRLRKILHFQRQQQLQKIEKEKEALRLKQLELIQQEIEIKRSMMEDDAPLVSQLQQAHIAPVRTAHIRQESGDSGLDVAAHTVHLDKCSIQHSGIDVNGMSEIDASTNITGTCSVANGVTGMPSHIMMPKTHNGSAVQQFTSGEPQAEMETDEQLICNDELFKDEDPLSWLMN